MSLRIFISYSHRDDAILDRLKVHLRMLEREGSVETWSDREIHAGANVDSTIADAQDTTTVFMPLVSPDFLASSYCYDIEMKTALKKAASGKIAIIPVIAEPCDWLASPLKAFKALPKDGKPVSEWANANNAYLDIIQELRRVAKNGSRATTKTVGEPSTPFSAMLQRVKIQRDFSSIDRAKFRDAAYAEIRKFFSESIAEFSQIEGLQGDFEDMDVNAFTCTIVNRAKRGAEASLTVRNSKGGGHSALGDITFVFDAYAQPGSANEIVNVDSDEFHQFLELSGMRGFGRNSEHRLSAGQVADIMWRDFLARAGIDYE